MFVCTTILEGMHTPAHMGKMIKRQVQNHLLVFLCVCVFFQIVRVGYVCLGKDLSNTSHIDACFRNRVSYSNCLLIFPK